MDQALFILKNCGNSSVIQVSHLNASKPILDCCAILLTVRCFQQKCKLVKGCDPNIPQDLVSCRKYNYNFTVQYCDELPRLMAPPKSNTWIVFLVIAIILCVILTASIIVVAYKKFGKHK